MSLGIGIWTMPLSALPLITYCLITPPPWEKRFGFYNPNLYLSPPLSFVLDFLWNSVNSQLSLVLQGERRLDVSSLCRDWWGSCMDRGNEWEDIGVKGGVLGTSWYDTRSALILVMTQHRSLVWRMQSLGVQRSQIQKCIVYNIYKNNKYNKCLQETL